MDTNLGWFSLVSLLLFLEPQPVTAPCDPPILEDATLTPSKTEYDANEVVTITCFTGFHPTDDLTLICEGDGWSGPPAVCTGITCVPPVSVPHANYTPFQDSYNYSDEVVYSCELGFTVVNGYENRTCILLDTWSGVPVTCEAITCSPLDEPNATDHVTYSPVKLMYSYLDTVNYTCDPGYQQNDGDFTRSCEDVDTWSGVDPSCIDIDECNTTDSLCLNNGTCVNFIGGYACNCTGTGFDGDNCEEVDLCYSDPCLNGGVCKQFGNELFLCLCEEGYFGSLCEKESRFRSRWVVLLMVFPVSHLFDIDIWYIREYESRKFLKQFLKFMWKRMKRRKYFRGARIRKMWKGSLNIDISVGIEDTANAISDLTLAISFLGQETFIVLNQQATVSSISVDGAVVSTSSTDEAKCKLYTAIMGGCPEGERCVVEDSLPSCRTKSMLFVGAVIAACLGLLIIFSTIIIIILLWKRGKRRSVANMQVDDPMRTMYIREKPALVATGN